MQQAAEDRAVARSLDSLKVTTCDTVGDVDDEAGSWEVCCAMCGVTGTKLKRCSKCRTTSYCNRECQKGHWKTHKHSCAILSRQSDVAKTQFVPPTPDKSWGAGVIWLHGLGDTGAGWTHLQHQLGWQVTKAAGAAAKWLFPTAPEQKVTCNGGFSMRSWMDLEAIPVVVGCKDAASDIRDSIRHVHEHIDALLAEGIPADKVVVGGFSQGGCLALLATLSYPKKLAGGVVLSGWLALRDQLKHTGAAAGGEGSESGSGGGSGGGSGAAREMLHSANAETRILWCHGDADDKVLHECQLSGVSALEELGVSVTSRTYPGLGHASSPAETKDVGSFLEAVLKQQQQ